MADVGMYDFVVNDEDEVMLLLYAGNTEPKNAKIVLKENQNQADFFRNPDECIVLDDIPGDIFDSLLENDTLLVCEISNTEKDEDSKIVYAYEADIED